LYASPNIVTVDSMRMRMRMTGHVARTVDMRHVYKVSIGKPECKRPLGRLYRTWEDNIRVHLRETRKEVVDWKYKGHDRNQ